MIHCFSSLTSEVSLVDAEQPETAAQVFLPRQQGHLYELAHHETGFYILSNNKPPNKKILFSQDVPANLESCEVLVGHDASILIEGINAFQDFLLIEERQNGFNPNVYGRWQTTGQKFQCRLSTKKALIAQLHLAYFMGMAHTDTRFLIPLALLASAC